MHPAWPGSTTWARYLRCYRRCSPCSRHGRLCAAGGRSMARSPFAASADTAFQLIVPNSAGSAARIRPATASAAATSFRSCHHLGARSAVSFITTALAIAAARRVASDERMCRRQAEAVPLLAALHAFLLEQEDWLPPKHPLAQAIQYTLNQWPELTLFTTDPAVPIHNNLAEQQMKRIALLRKNALFVATPAAAKRPPSSAASPAPAAATKSTRRPTSPSSWPTCPTRPAAKLSAGCRISGRPRRSRRPHQRRIRSNRHATSGQAGSVVHSADTKYPAHAPLAPSEMPITRLTASSKLAELSKFNSASFPQSRITHEWMSQ